MPENPSDNMTHNAKAHSPKARLVTQIARLIKKQGLKVESFRSEDKERTYRIA